MSATIRMMRRKVDAAFAKRDLIQSERDTLLKKQEELWRQLHLVESAQTFLEQIAQATQRRLKIRIESMVQLALDECFPAYTFMIDFETSAGRTTANISLLKHGRPVTVMRGTGGGVSDITAFALRVATQTLGKTAKVMLMDEPFKNISADLVDRAGNILRELAGTAGIQSVVVTHEEFIIDVADKTFKIEASPDANGWLVSRIAGEN